MNMGGINRMWNGDMSLPQIFRLHGVAVFVVALPIVMVSFIVMAAFGGFYFVGLFVAAFAAAYQVLVSIAILRSATHYTGAKIWAVLARVVAGLSLVALIIGILKGYGFVLNSPDSSRNSANASQFLSRASGYPLTGFWKGSCSLDYGLLIEPTKVVSVYSVSLCGVRGCYRPGKSHPNSTISNDPKYHVVDSNTIVVYDYGGESATQYIRCE